MSEKLNVYNNHFINTNMLLIEIFDNPPLIKWVTNTSTEKQATCVIGEEVFVAKFVPFNYHHQNMSTKHKSWTMSFVSSSESEDWLTGTGNSIQFSSALFQILLQAANFPDVQGLFIEARPEPSRIRVFSRLLKRLASKLNWKLYDEGEKFKHFWWYAAP